MNWVRGQTWLAFMDCFYVPRLLQRFFCDDNVFTPQTELCAAQVVQTRKITHKSGQQCFFDAPKSSSVVSDNIYCQQTFLAFFCKGSQGMKMPMPSRHHQNLQRLNFRLSSVYLQNHRPWKLNSSCNSTQLPPIWRRIPCFSFAKPWISKQARQLQSWKNFNFSIL